MERFQTVNDSSGREGEIARFDPHPTGGSVPGLEVEPSFDTVAASSENFGPCLYLGPQGQRCSERALRNGFCGKHQPGVVKAARRTSPRVVGAGIGIIAAMWPVVADVLREIIRWIHSH
jgi:hypothetical protein